MTEGARSPTSRPLRGVSRVLGAVALTAGLASGLFRQVVISTLSLPDGEFGLVYPPRTLEATGDDTPFSWELTAGLLPPGLTLSGFGVISGTPSLSGTFTFTVRVTDTVEMTDSKSLSITVPLLITTNSLPNGTLNGAYPEQTLTATSGGTTPYSWSLVDTNLLPPGLMVSDSGVISGTPTAVGTFSFEVEVQDADSTLNSEPKELTITIDTPLSITTTTLPDGRTGSVYPPRALSAAGGTSPYVWGLASGIFPPGLTLSGFGVISGTPSLSGTFTFTVRVTDDVGMTDSKSLSITVPLLITTNSLPSGTLNGAYPEQTLTATPGGTTPYLWSVVDTNLLPPGLMVFNSGVISGTPTAVGTFSFEVEVQDADSTLNSEPKELTITIDTPLSITTTTLPDGTVGAAYPPRALNAAGGTSPYVWRLASGIFPPGMTISNGGVLSGTPALAGRFEFEVIVGDSSSPQTATQSLPIGVAPVITTSSLPTGAVGTAYPPETLTATPGTTSYTWSLLSGSLPDGLTLSSDGIIRGTPTTAGTFSVQVGLVDESVPVLTASEFFEITIQSELQITTASELPAGVAGAFYSVPLQAAGPSPLGWSGLSGALPPGLTLSASGSLSGVPVISGNFEFTIQAAGGSPLQTTSRSFQLSVGRALAITISPILPDATLSAPYSVALAAEGGRPEYTWTNPDRAAAAGAWACPPPACSAVHRRRWAVSHSTCRSPTRTIR